MPANRTKLLGLVAFGIVGVAILVIAGTVAVIRKDSGSVREKEADVVLKDWWHPSVTSAKLERMIEKLQYAPPGYVWFNHKAEISFLGAAQEGDWRGHRCFEIPYEGPHSRAKVLYWLVNSFVPEDLGL